MSPFPFSVPKKLDRLRLPANVQDKRAHNRTELSFARPNPVAEANNTEGPKGECAPVHRLVRSFDLVNVSQVPQVSLVLQTLVGFPGECQRLIRLCKVERRCNLHAPAPDCLRFGD